MAPNINSMSRHLSLLDLTGPAMARSLSDQAMSRVLSGANLQADLASLHANDHQAPGKAQIASAPPPSGDYWGWDSDSDDGKDSSTDHVVKQAATIELVSEQSAPSEPLASYWDWPSDVPPIEEEPEQVAVDVLSLASIEANLIKASANFGVKNDGVAVLDTSNDDYWAEADCPSDEEPTHSESSTRRVPLHVSYWDWPTTTKEEDRQAEIDAIMAYETARKAVSGNAIEQSLRAQAGNELQRVISPPTKPSDVYWTWKSERAVQSARMYDATHPDYDYWTWTNNDSSEVDAILDYERARLLLSADHIEDQLCQNAATPSSDLVFRSDTADSEDYWHAPSEALGDAYWNERPMPVALSAAGKSYWDW